MLDKRSQRSPATHYLRFFWYQKIENPSGNRCPSSQPKAKTGARLAAALQRLFVAHRDMGNVPDSSFPFDPMSRCLRVYLAVPICDGVTEAARLGHML